MKSSGIAIMTLGMLLCACGGPKAQGKLIRGTTVHPLLKTWVVPIGAPGRVISSSGKSWKLDKNNYIELGIGSAIAYEDLLRFKKGSAITIGFDDGSRLTIDPRDYPEQNQGDDVYFTIERKERQPANQAL